MNVILCENVENLGEMGNQVQVADGYARNYLIPRKLAVLADSASAKQIEHELRIIKRKEVKRRGELTLVADKMSDLTLEFQMRAGGDDKIFGSVTTAMIAARLVEEGFTITRRQVILEEPIKSLGIFTVRVRLLSGIEATVKAWVTGLEEEVTTVVDEEMEAAEASDAAFKD
ncbi:MAG: 50S ribosomal protein L9 [Candidatus Hydrogenedentes bacterium]|nr:50S ribosomal protein L9 [Candidatus Hydrogenedentota bacterium]